ncbi:MAG: hypothetical protein ACI8YQ_000899 [Polaribacter sp.]|jgi:hypothetical protein
MIRSILFSLILLSIFSCTKDDPTFPKTTTRVTFKTQHHERAVPFIDVYLKYDTDTFPGYDDISIFDTMIVSDEYGDVTFPRIPVGKHWVVGFGKDEFLMEPVRGGLPFEIKDISMPWDSSLYISEF